MYLLTHLFRAQFNILFIKYLSACMLTVVNTQIGRKNKTLSCKSWSPSFLVAGTDAPMDQRIISFSFCHLITQGCFQKRNANRVHYLTGVHITHLPLGINTQLFCVMHLAINRCYHCEELHCRGFLTDVNIGGELEKGAKYSE